MASGGAGRGRKARESPKVDLRTLEREWQALAEAMQDVPPEGVTMHDIAIALGVSVGTARSKVREAALAGRIECVGYRTVERSDGRILRHHTPVYRLVDGTS